jgi:hypothetical protein
LVEVWQLFLLHLIMVWWVIGLLKTKFGAGCLPFGQFWIWCCLYLCQVLLVRPNLVTYYIGYWRLQLTNSPSTLALLTLHNSLIFLPHRWVGYLSTRLPGLMLIIWLHTVPLKRKPSSLSGRQMLLLARFFKKQPPPFLFPSPWWAWLVIC